MVRQTLSVVCVVLVCFIGLHEGRHSGGLFSIRRLYNPTSIHPFGSNNSNYNYYDIETTESSVKSSDHCSTNYSFDYVQLTLVWPPGSCSTSARPCKKEEDKHFTIHGMWPTIKGTQKPAFCCFDNTFDYNALQPLMDDMNEYWYSYYGDSSREFWTHEWLKHGTCARDFKGFKGELRYFGNTLEIAKKLPILESLKKFNIVPDNERKYSSSDILKALEPIGQGKVVQIDCDLEHHQPTPVLTGIAICFDADSKPADCPASKSRCQKELIFKQTSTKSRKHSWF